MVAVLTVMGREAKPDTVAEETEFRQSAPPPTRMRCLLSEVNGTTNACTKRLLVRQLYNYFFIYIYSLIYIKRLSTKWVVTAGNNVRGTLRFMETESVTFAMVLKVSRVTVVEETDTKATVTANSLPECSLPGPNTTTDAFTEQVILKVRDEFKSIDRAIVN